MRHEAEKRIETQWAWPEIAEQFAPIWRVAFSFKVRADISNRDKLLSFSNICRINQNEGSIRKVIVVSGF
jgi:hypothetical protein